MFTNAKNRKEKKEWTYQNTKTSTKIFCMQKQKRKETPENYPIIIMHKLKPKVILE